MVVNKPPLGWNSWNTYAEKIDEALILESARALKESGLADAGYNYVVIDDCWALHERGKDGKLVKKNKKFPRGMKVLADEIHALYKGLKKSDRDTLRQILRSVPDRVHTILPGLAILKEILDAYQVSTVTVSACGVREGYLLQRVMGVDSHAS